MFSSSKDTKTSSTGSGSYSTSNSVSGGTTAAATVPSIISPDLKITGNLKSAGDIQIDGRVEGDIDSRQLVVGEGAQVDGSIRADTVRISGSVNGEVQAKSVTLERTARVVGDIVHGSLTMEAGAYLEGGVRRLDSTGNGKVATLRPASSSSCANGDGKYSESASSIY